jgi:hypothetical protein
MQAPPPPTTPTIEVITLPDDYWSSDGYIDGGMNVIPVFTYEGQCTGGTLLGAWKEVQANKHYAVEIAISYKETPEGSGQSVPWLELRYDGKIGVKELKTGAKIGDATVCMREGDLYLLP